MNLYTIYDRQAEMSGPVFEAVNDDIAIRKTCHTLKDVVFVEDYRLYKLGSYDPRIPVITTDPELTFREIDFMHQFIAYQTKLTEISVEKYNVKKEILNDKKSV